MKKLIVKFIRFLVLRITKHHDVLNAELCSCDWCNEICSFLYKLQLSVEKGVK